MDPEPGSWCEVNFMTKQSNLLNFHKICRIQGSDPCIFINSNLNSDPQLCLPPCIHHIHDTHDSPACTVSGLITFNPLLIFYSFAELVGKSSREADICPLLSKNSDFTFILRLTRALSWYRCRALRPTEDPVRGKWVQNVLSGVSGFKMYCPG